MTKYAPIWLPVAFFVRDVAAWIYVFSYEPGITEGAVHIHHFLLMPGVIFSVQWSFAFNIVFGVLLGFAIRESARHHFPIWPWLLMVTWDIVVLGAFAFLLGEGAMARRTFKIGMLPGRYLSHLLFRWKLVTDNWLLLFIAVAANIGLAVVLAAAYRTLRPVRGQPSARTMGVAGQRG